MQLTVNVDASEALRVLRNGEKRKRYAIVNALNRAVKDMQRAEVENAKRVLTVRRSEFLLGSGGRGGQVAVIRGAAGGSGFASVSGNRYEVRMAVGQKPRLMLAEYEEGGERPKFTPGAKGVAVPKEGSAARPTFKSQVPPHLLFKALQMRESFSGATKKARRRSAVVKASARGQWKGKQRTFILRSTSRAPMGGVFQRVGPGRDDIRLAYSFARPKRLAKLLRFIPTARAVADRVFQKYLTEEVNAAFTYAARAA